MWIRSHVELALMLIDRRKAMGLTQSEVAVRAGLKQKTISAMENKPENAKVSTLFKVISALHLDLELEAKEKAKIEWEEEW